MWSRVEATPQAALRLGWGQRWRPGRYMHHPHLADEEAPGPFAAVDPDHADETIIVFDEIAQAGGPDLA
jgi:hypothetical protein